MKRYHPLLVVMHWLLALMICVGLVMGGNVLSATPNSDPEKLVFLKIHLTMGFAMLVLMAIRLIVRFFTAKPDHADIGNTLLNKLGVAAHYLLYLLVFLLAASGIGIAQLAELPEIIFLGSGAALPVDFSQFPPRIAHGILAKLLMLLIVGHVAAFLYHQFILRDGLFSRMWFGQR